MKWPGPGSINIPAAGQHPTEAGNPQVRIKLAGGAEEWTFATHRDCGW